MGVSTNGQICYGFMFEEGYEFPWDTDVSEHDEGDIEAWWRGVNNYKNPLFYPFTVDGDYKPDVNKDDPRISEYFTHQGEWMIKNPVPVEEVNYCSGDCPMYILAIPSTVITNRRGTPLVISAMSFLVPEKERIAIIKFMEKYNIVYDNGPDWFLSSYWG